MTAMNNGPDTSSAQAIYSDAIMAARAVRRCSQLCGASSGELARRGASATSTGVEARLTRVSASTTPRRGQCEWRVAVTIRAVRGGRSGETGRVKTDKHG